MTIGEETGGVGEAPGEGEGDDRGDGDGEGVGPLTASAVPTDSMPRAEAKICAIPAPIPVARPDWLTVVTPLTLDLHLKTTSLTSSPLGLKARAENCC